MAITKKLTAKEKLDAIRAAKKTTSVNSTPPAAPPKKRGRPPGTAKKETAAPATGSKLSNLLKGKKNTAAAPPAKERKPRVKFAVSAEHQEAISNIYADIETNFQSLTDNLVKFTDGTKSAAKVSREAAQNITKLAKELRKQIQEAKVA